MRLKPDSILVFILISLMGIGCKDEKKADDTSARNDTSVDSGGDSTETEDSEEELPPPCSGASWGAITHSESAVHVSQELGSPKGDGSMADPVSTITEAVRITRARATDKYIAVWPGLYQDNVSLRLVAPEDTTDSGTVIQGCSVEEVTVIADDPGGAVFSISEARGVEISNLSSQGGTRGIEALTGAELTLDALRVQGAAEVGILIHGGSTDDTPATTASLVDVEVRDTNDVEGAFGYGLAFQAGAIATMTRGGAYDNKSVGILADLVMSLELDGVEVRGTVADASGYLGRGIQVQRGSSASIRNAVVAGNQDAGIFGLGAENLDLRDNEVDRTLESDIPEAKDDSGDGIVISRGMEGKKPEYYHAVLNGNRVTGCARAGVVIDGVVAESNTSG